jgi:hypothetical protein
MATLTQRRFGWWGCRRGRRGAEQWWRGAPVMGSMTVEGRRERRRGMEQSRVAA